MAQQTYGEWMRSNPPIPNLTAVEWLQAEFNKWAEGRVFIPQDILEQAKQMEKDQMKVQTSIDLLKDKAQKAWTPCHGCDDNDKNFWINGYIHGALEN